MKQYVGVILVKSDGSVLAQHRDNKPTILGPDKWGVVGGALDTEDTSLADAASRELEEETGYIVDPKTLVFLIKDTYITERGTPVERTIFYAPYDGQQPILTNEGQEIKFVSPEELKGLDIYTGHEGFLRSASEQNWRGGVESKF